MKQFFFLCFLLPLAVFGQREIPEFGQLTDTDINTTNFPGQPEASGIVLYERGEYTVGTNQHYIILIHKVHVKIKVLDAKNFNYGTVEIPVYTPRDGSESVEKLRAITHNGITQKSVPESAVYEEKVNKRWRNIKFAFPDIRDGSILEYSYELHTPYFSRLRGWNFANPLPTLYSELHTEIPGNFIYTRTLYGNRSLDVNKAEIKKGCFHLPGFRVAGDCEIATYAMRNVPAYEKEDFMLSYENYIPSLAFELAQRVDLSESRHYYANSWKNVDDRLKNDRNFGSQLKLTKYFKDFLPSEISLDTDALTRAKSVFYHISKNINWDGEIPFIHDIDVKKAFESGAGNATEINLGLANALNAANLDAKIMLVATRSARTPSKEHPVFYGFDYPIVLLTIGQDTYLLDATEKTMTFGILPSRALNQYGRVIDFKKGSYWMDIAPFDKNMHYGNIQMELDENGKLSGTVQEAFNGFLGAEKRKNNANRDRQQLLSRKQQTVEKLNISDFTIENENDPEKAYVEKYDFESLDHLSASRIFLNPFVISPFENEAAFMKSNRNYPIDFGFPFTTNFLIGIDLKGLYEVVALPDNQRIVLPNNEGEFAVVYDHSQADRINIRFNFKLNKYHFPTEAYQSLKEFFNQIISIQNAKPIELMKK